MSPKRTRTCVIYVRISLSTEESVSIDRQVEAAEAYAKARGWTVVGTFKDEGVSATHNKPEARKGWQALLATPTKYDAVVIWKVDRLARRVLDFLNANEAVKARGAGIVAVEDPIDMTTAQGEAFAIMLAVFGQMEAAQISARVTAARSYLLRNGRHAGGALPYGYRSAPNPNGPGWVVVQDEEVIDYVREVVRRTLAGLSLYSSQLWLDEVGAPTPTELRARRYAEECALTDPAAVRAAAKAGDLDALRGLVSEPSDTRLATLCRYEAAATTDWHYGTVDKMVRQPMLAGMVPHNPQDKARNSAHPKVRGDGLVRDNDGLPVMYEHLAVMPWKQWEAMQAKLAEPIRAQRVPVALRPKRDRPVTHSAVLSGLLWCGDLRHDTPVRMRRSTTSDKTTLRPAYKCPQCHQSLTNGEDLIVQEFLSTFGHLPHLRMVEEVVEGGSVQYEQASSRLAELGRELVTADPDRAAELFAEMQLLKELQERAKAQPGTVRLVIVGGPERTYAEDWAAATTDEERRTIIGHALRQVIVRRPTAKDPRSDAAKLARLTFEWMPVGDALHPPTNEELEAWSA